MVGPAPSLCWLALGYRHSLGRLGNTEELSGGWDDGNPLHLPCVSQSMLYCDSGFGKSSSHGHLTAHGFPNLTHFGLSKAAAVS